MSDLISPWQEYGFSGLSAALSRIQEIIRPTIEALQSIQSTLQPIVETIEQYKSNVAEIGQTLLHVSCRFTAIEKMRDRPVADSLYRYGSTGIWLGGSIRGLNGVWISNGIISCKRNSRKPYHY